MWLQCDYLGSDVELTAERERHTRRRHPGLTAGDIAETLRRPDGVIRRPWLLDELLFARDVDDPAGGKHIVVAVLQDEPSAEGSPPRRWVVTAYRTDTLPIGVVEWERD